MDEAISFPKVILMGTKVRLRNESFRDIKIRDWRFSGVEKGKLVLLRPEGYILKVKFEDIDWEVRNRPKIED